MHLHTSVYVVGLLDSSYDNVMRMGLHYMPYNLLINNFTERKRHYKYLSYPRIDLRKQSRPCPVSSICFCKVNQNLEF